MNRILSAPEILTGRLLPAPLRGSDVQALFDCRSDPEGGRYQTWPPRSVEEAVDFIDGFHAIDFDTPGTWFQLGIRLRDVSLVVGDLGVHFRTDEPHQAEIGFTVTPGQHGRGFETEPVAPPRRPSAQICGRAPARTRRQGTECRRSSGCVYNGATLFRPTRLR